ncbi:efflux RND transporter periplasmic adaptor subunit [Daejeonella sp.]|jgi:Cu(I)/Ag(I) efflux system membrane fusion protein|uniref:efflux RND transporter periplasmic adaptor subunit n=1 Tax=Daejeonella sp. TaxID=2805397 RepID=UPI0027BAE6E5|nr:efflux RND transporter periplasmic adaptor subunit [Daejeonella sp.]
MKRKIVVSLILISLGYLVFTLPSCKDPEHDKTTKAGKYTCPMHPQIVNNGPGSCAICKMDLVPLNSSGGKNELSLSDSQIQMANVQTVKISSSSFSTSKVLNGRLVVNPERSALVSSRYSGRVEKLYIREIGGKIKKGQALFQVYSEELQTLQQDYLLQLKQVAAFPDEKIYGSMREAAKNKLRLFGLSDAQIRSLDQGAKASPLLTVFSNAAGTVTELNITEGQYITEGSQVLKLENFDQLWLEMDVYPSEISGLTIGMKVKALINGISENEQTLQIDFISPQLDPSTQILKVRAPIQNFGNLQAGMQATVFLPVSEISDAMSLPLDAVVRDEKGAHVWIKTAKNTFSPRMVKTGEESSDQIIILSGLEDVKEVVISGAYLLSSEFIFKKGIDPAAGHEIADH